MWEAHQKYGSLPWKAPVEPAVKLAEQDLTNYQAQWLKAIMSQWAWWSGSGVDLAKQAQYRLHVH